MRRDDHGEAEIIRGSHPDHDAGLVAARYSPDGAPIIGGPSACRNDMSKEMMIRFRQNLCSFSWPKSCACVGASRGPKLSAVGKFDMAVLHPIRTACPVCGRPMKLVKDDAGTERERYVPLYGPNARKWLDSPLKPPAK